MLLKREDTDAMIRTLSEKGPHELGTKADTLKLLYRSLKNAQVLPQYTFTVDDFYKKENQILQGFYTLEWNSRVIVRSSAQNEDTDETSQAGKYESIADVAGKEAFKRAVETVIGSYDDDDPDNQVLVQPMLEQVSICGVAFTLEPNTAGNYYVVNYDQTGSTAGITSGQEEAGVLYYRFKGWDADKDRDKRTGLTDRRDCTDDSGCEKQDEWMNRLCSALKEIEDFFGRDSLDVEFAFTEGDILYILQVRPLCMNKKAVPMGSQSEALGRIAKKIRNSQQQKPFLCGKRTAYSVMTDWNPAEMIGIRPKPLAMSLYREIITDSVWAYQRDNYGYRNLRSCPLMVDFAGLPYIDVRVSFNSFIPSGLDEQLSEKLVDYYLDRLQENPQKHDKAEFEIVYSCYTLDLPERIAELLNYGFTDDEVRQVVDALRDVTNCITDYRSGLWRGDYHKIDILNKRYGRVMGSSMGKIEKVYWLLEDCKRYGTLPFAGLARAAFIAVQMLRSFVSDGILSAEDYDAFMNGIETVGTKISRDSRQLPRAAFLEKYGHLRPGTYDITSPRYDEAPELYFGGMPENSKDAGDCGQPEEGGSREFRLSLDQLNRLRDRLQENGLSNDVLDIMEFMKSVIEGREYGKFVFTRSLSMALKLIGQIGEEYGISRDECAFASIRPFYELYASAGDVREGLLESIRHGKEGYGMTMAVTLPPVITDEGDVYDLFYPDSEPNFITAGRACGDVRVVDGMCSMPGLEGGIVLMQSADPGYDWIFSHGISGFITMYGGANSHMAIRAAELGIPAAIGVGAKQFAGYSTAEVIEIDALLKTVKVMR